MRAQVQTGMWLTDTRHAILSGSLGADDIAPWLHGLDDPNGGRCSSSVQKDAERIAAMSHSDKPFRLTRQMLLPTAEGEAARMKRRLPGTRRHLTLAIQARAVRQRRA